MNNPLYDIIRKANEQKWCMTPYCTTCGAREYRKALKDLAGPLGGGLANALSDINPQDITSIPNWQDIRRFNLFHHHISSTFTHRRQLKQGIA